MKEDLYFIALVPPQPIQDQITDLKKVVAEKFESNHALKSPPHITLHMPFKWKIKRRDELLGMIQKLNQQFTPFEIELKDFDFFEPRVVFVDVVENEELGKVQSLVVDHCRKTLKLDNANYRNKPFHPHVTIGFRDLRKRKFFEARDFFSNQTFNARFTPQEVSLLKHDGTKWLIVENP